MKLHAGIVPSAEALRDTLAVTRAALPSARPSLGLAGSRSERRGRVDRDASTTRLLPQDEMFVTLAHFGSVTPNDAARLTRAVALAATEWEPPTLHVVGVEVQPSVGGVVVLAQLGGDVGALQEIARSLNRAAHGAGFLLDRRNFRARFPLASISDRDPMSVQRVVRVFGSRRGTDWQAEEIVLLREAVDDTTPRFEVIERIPLGAAAPPLTDEG